MKPINPKFNRNCRNCEFFKFRMLWPEAGKRFKLFDWVQIPVMVYSGEDFREITEDMWPDNPVLYLYGKKFIGVYYWDGVEFVLSEKRALVG